MSFHVNFGEGMFLWRVPYLNGLLGTRGSSVRLCFGQVYATWFRIDGYGLGVDGS